MLVAGAPFYFENRLVESSIRAWILSESFSDTHVCVCLFELFAAMQ